MPDYISGEIRGYIEIPNGVDVRVSFETIDGGYRMTVSNAGQTQSIDLYGFEQDQIEQIRQMLTSVQTATETAQGKAEDAQAAAETAQGKAEDAQTAAESAATRAEDAESNAAAGATNAQTYAGQASQSATAAAQSAASAAGDAQSAAASAQRAAQYSTAVTSTDNTLIFSCNE